MKLTDITQLRVGLVPAMVGAVTIGGWIFTTHGWAKDTEAAVADLQEDVAAIQASQKAEAKEDRKLRDAVNALIVELRVRGAVSEAETAEAAPVEEQ